ncbi:YraN family protein [Candidatus Dependentiae bacterium]|nr:YraN family protein [Candidatus Dependentiae bacterium]
MSIERIALGKKGEELVARFLEQAGFSILEQNYSIKQGEIDIIARKEEVLAFVEVKLRRNPLFSLSELIVPSKQRKIVTTALWYINKHNFQDMIYRFDVALVEGTQTDYTINYIENAFTASY